MQFLTQTIYQLATGLLVPVLAALVALLGGTLFAVGAFLREWRSRRLATSPHADLATLDDKTLTDFELAASARLAWLSFGARTGPLLGLMGTLIPMGPALVGLSTGDIEAMAGNLVIVFSTTVVGVLIGGLCFGMLLVRRQWYARDLAELERRLMRSQDTRRSASANAREEERIDAR